MKRASVLLSLLRDPPRFLFFIGKGGVGKTSLACACALALADAGRRVLLLSTDPASKSGTKDPLLRSRLAGEGAQMARITGGLSRRSYVVPWVRHPPIGIASLREVVDGPARAGSLLNQSPAASSAPTGSCG